MTFGERLTELRESTGLSQSKFAQTAGVNVGSYRQFEYDEVYPSFAAFIKILNALELKPAEFFEGVELY